MVISFLVDAISFRVEAMPDRAEGGYCWMLALLMLFFRND
jgi:hypothetical protein